MKVKVLINPVVAGLLAFFAATVQADCGTDSWTVNVDEVNMTVVPKELEVCNGDVVTWQTNGPSNFHVIFAAGGPPGNPAQGDGTYSVTINAPVGRYKYDVKINGVSLDPTIIVFR